MKRQWRNWMRLIAWTERRRRLCKVCDPVPQGWYRTKIRDKLRHHCRTSQRRSTMSSGVRPWKSRCLYTSMKMARVSTMMSSRPARAHDWSHVNPHMAIEIETQFPSRDSLYWSLPYRWLRSSRSILNLGLVKKRRIAVRAAMLSTNNTSRSIRRISHQD